MKGILWPACGLRTMGAVSVAALAGAVMAGVYGIAHDQVTYSISPEYFTAFKFEQFRSADFGLPVRVFVAEIGFLATWWAGLLADWVVGRIVFSRWSGRVAWRMVFVSLAAILGVAVAAGLAGFVWAVLKPGDHPGWAVMCGELGVRDVEAFMKVGCIHNAGYVGGLSGLVTVVAVLLGKGRKAAPAG